MRIWIRARISLGVVLFVGLAGCDWGSRSRTYPHEFTRVDSQVARLFGGPPSESTEGYTRYGDQKPPRPGYMLANRDAVVEVKKKGPRKTTVEIKVRRSADHLLWHDRTRLPESEKEFLSRLEQALQVADPPVSTTGSRSWESSKITYRPSLLLGIAGNSIEVVVEAKKRLMGIIQGVPEIAPDDVARLQTLGYFTCGMREFAWKGKYLLEHPPRPDGMRMYSGQFLLELHARLKSQQQLSPVDLGQTEGKLDR